MGSVSSPTEGNVTITSFEVVDLRFPTSLDGVGSDAMHVGTNGSHPYIRLNTNHGDLVGEGIVRQTGMTSFLANLAQLINPSNRPSATAVAAS